MKPTTADSRWLSLSAGVFALVSASFVSLPPAYAAEEPCGNDEIIIECLERRQNEMLVDKTRTEATEDLSIADLSSLDKGSLRGFLETFLAQIDGVSTSADEADLKIVYNAPNQRLSAEATLHQAEVSAAILEAYPKEDREDLEKDLGKGLDDADDVEAKVVLNFCRSEGDWRFGRRVKDYQDLLRKLVERALTTTAADQEVRKAHEQQMMALGPRASGGPPVGILSWGALKATDDTAAIERARAVLLSNASRDLFLARHQVFRQQIKESGVADFYKLVANQPQIYLELGGRIRDEAVGPDSWAGKFVWEMPQGRNVNKLVDFCRDSGREANLACFQQYMSLAETEASLDSKPRWKLEIKGAGIQPWEFRDPATSVLKIDEPSDTKATLAASYSRVLRYVQVKNTESGELEDVEASRIDFEAAGEYVDNEEVFQRRIKATLTLTNRLNDNFDAALSFVWASDPEFRDEVDKDFSATAGIRFKVRQRATES